MNFLDDALRIIPETSDNHKALFQGAQEIKKKINDLLPLLLSEEKIVEKRLAEIRSLVSQLKGIRDSSQEAMPAAEAPIPAKMLAGKSTRYIVLKILQSATRPMKAAEIIQEIRRIN